MPTIGTTGSLVGAAALLLGAPALAQSATYTVDSYESQDIALTLCDPQVRVEVRGDGDTDLDFTITDPAGAVIHSDVDDTDWTVATVDNLESGCRDYNLHVENYGSVYNEYTVTLVSLGSASGDGRNRRVAVHNHTGETIYYVFWSNTGDDTWRQDRLGSDVLLDENEWIVEVDDGSGACRFDFKVRTANSREIVRNNVNVCEVSVVDFR